MSQVKALLCDIDGTLLHSNWLHAAAWQKAFGAIGIHLQLEDIRRQIGKGGDELIPVFVPWWKREAVEEPLEAFRKHIFQTDYLPDVKPFPRVRELLVTVQRRGIRVALASSSSRDDIARYIKIAHIEDVIEASTSADDARRSKPHPDIFTAALKKVNANPHEALALGDTPYDAEAAGKAGVLTIGVTTGGWSQKELLDAGCIEAYNDVADLLEHIDQSAISTFNNSRSAH